ncbi:nicotinate-nucleotide--dimethylbenzimidazole phosphoribosyltransferase [Streptomyces mutabilis]|uniref:nicotinate-nucleotide--dimethylbenzimidazole phosphoribosyltransferase n=1 Tax=Streptomyces mutabilis TaxID=67332 RepID=UPI00369115A2
MTDTGQIPGEGLPENAGMVEQPGVPAPGAYTYLSETTAEDEDLLLLPGAQSAWGNEVAPPAPEPVVETVHQPGPHEMSGRDSGSVDLGGVRLPEPAHEPVSAPAPPRRPLHLGPPIPDTSASPVRSLADRGPADAPVRHAGPAASGPEYLDVPHTAAMPPQGAAPWGAQASAQAQQPAEVPVGTGTVRAETVIPAADQAPEPVGAAQALVARVATEAVAATGGETGEAGVPAADAHAEVSDPTGGAPGDADGAGADVAPGDGTTSGRETPAGGDEARSVAAEPVVGEAPVPEAVAEPVTEEAPASEAVDGAGAGEAPAPDTVPGPEAEQATAAALPETGAEKTAAPDQAFDPAPADEAGPVEPAADAVQPVADAVQPVADAVQPVAEAPGPSAPEAAQAAGSAEPAEETAPEPVQPVEPAGAPEPAQVSGPAQAVEASQAQDAAETAAQSPEPVQTVAEPADVPQPVQTAEYTEAPEPQEAPAAEAPVTGPDQAVSVVAAGQAPGESAAEPAGHEPSPQTATATGQSATATGQPVTATGQPATAPETTAQPTDTAQPVQAMEDHSHADVQAAPVQAAPQDAVAHSAAHQPGFPPAADAQPDAQPVPDGQSAPGDAQPVQGPQSLAGTDVSPEADASHPAPEPPVADAAPADGVRSEPHPDQPAQQGPEQPVGQFVPVDGGQVPTTPHLAPTPPEALVVPPQTWENQAAQAPQEARGTQDAPQAPEPVAPVPAPREADPEVAQNADDLDTRAADQEDAHDVSTTAEAEARQSTGPAAPAYADAEREAVLKVMRERRDIRNGFRSDPIPHEVLLRVLEAAHTAPSVGHSQPWDFVVIRSADTRRAMHELAMRQRDAYAKSLPKGRAKQFKELKIEAILDTPVNIVVTADPTRGGRHTLGRHTQPQMAPYSSALAVENLWLAARAEGLGVGWVSFFDEREMVRALGLPEHLDIVAYLCVGYVDEFPDEPELMQAGWSKRRPLSWVVHEETYGRRALPGEEPHDLLAETVAQIRPLDAKALGEAWERQKRMTKPAGALGMLEIISAQLSGLSRQCPPPIPEPAAVAVFAGDHGVHAQGVTPWPQEVTAQMVANFLGGGAVCNAFATQVGAEVCVVDVGVAADLPATPGLLPRKVRAGTSDMTAGPAMTREEAKQAIEVGIETARDLVAAGNKALLTGEMGIANTTASAALISVFTGADPAEVTGRGTGINDETLVRKTEVVRRAIEVHQPDPADPIGVLAAVGGFEHAAMVGLLLGGASLRTPVILDGVSAGAAALVARAIAPEVLAACIAGHRSAEPGHVAALNKLGLRPLVDLDLRLGEGTGALLALPMVQSTARAMHEVATFDSAGVTEK